MVVSIAKYMAKTHMITVNLIHTNIKTCGLAHMLVRFMINSIPQHQIRRNVYKSKNSLLHKFTLCFIQLVSVKKKTMV